MASRSIPASSQCNCCTLSSNDATAARPDKAGIFQSLLQQPKSVAIPAQDLDAVFPAVAKNEDGVGKGVHAQGVFNQASQAVDVLPEIDGISVQVHHARGVYLEHGKPQSVCMIADRS
jgi:hypothetical protein